MTIEEARNKWPETVMLREQNLGYSEIAHHLGLTKQGVRWRCVQCGLTGTRGEVTPKKPEKESARQKLNKRNENILADNDAGMTWDEIAAKYSMTKDAVRHVFIKYGMYIPQREKNASAKKEVIIKLRLEGKTEKEIAEVMGYKGPSYIHAVCKQAGLDKKWAFEQFTTLVREDRKAGASYDELAAKYNVSAATVAKACKGMPEPERIKNLRYKKIRSTGQKLRNAATDKYFAFLFQHGFEDLKREGNYYSAKCKECGHETKLHQTTLKHYIAGYLGSGDLQCEYCTTVFSKKKRLEDDLKAKFRAKDKQLLALINKRTKTAKRNMRYHPCIVCGKMTKNKKYCSLACNNKANWATKDAKRRVKIRNALVDNDISLKGLYERDHGVCHICGGICDYNDHQNQDGIFIAGYTYPSIDHVIPLARGGKHSWDNVKLAHWYCNTLKRDSISA